MQNLTELYLELRDPIYNYLLYLCGDSDRAQELTQEVFYQALVSLKRFRKDSSFKTWLFAIARNTYLKEYKKSMRRQSQQVELDETLSSKIPSHDLGPLASLVQSEEQQLLKKLIRELPETYRTVFVLREFEGWSYRELAQVMGKSENWVRVNYYRAKQLLKEDYLKCIGGDGNEN